jgi:N6-adenosine-specific RNA methylase IME4/ParB-like chromosome segregation protein Spo0J
MSSPIKSGDRARMILDTVLRDGFYQCQSEQEAASCRRLDGRGLLRKDKKDAWKFYPSERLKAKDRKEQSASTSAEGAARSAFSRAIDSIQIGTRLRPVNLADVEKLKVSISEHGLKTPISVYGAADAATVKLSAGGHRLEAMRQLGHTHIDCFHDVGEELDAELWEIDENLARSELTAADRALFMHRRKEIYSIKFPETAHGGDRKSSRQVGDLIENSVARFSSATAQATGQSERSIQRDAARGAKIVDMALHHVRGTRLDNGAFLDRLKLVPEDKQVLYVRAALEEEKRKAQDVKENRTAKMQVRREVRTGMLNMIAEQGELNAGGMPRAAFALGYADFPWEQEAYSDETGQDKGLMYPSMTVEDGMALCGGDRSPFTPDAKLYFWTTTNRMRDAMRIIEAWGFQYVTAITWDKVNMGMGREVRDRTEHLLICKRGSFPGIDMYVEKPLSLYTEVKTKHSCKPEWFAKEIERLHPTMRKLELFQRRESLADGDIRLNGNWHFWGFEAGVPEAQEAAE